MARAYQHDWTVYRACMVAEGAPGHETQDESEWIEAYQYLIDQNVVWSLQGSFGRRAAWLIEHGHCKRMDQE